MTTTTRKYLTDLAERLAFTGATTGAGVAVCHATGIPLAYAAPISVAVTLVKGVAARYVGTPATAGLTNTNAPDAAAQQAQAYDQATAVYAFLRRFLQHEIAVFVSTTSAAASPPVADIPQPAAVAAQPVDDSLPAPGA